MNSLEQKERAALHRFLAETGEIVRTGGIEKLSAPISANNAAKRMEDGADALEEQSEIARAEEKRRKAAVLRTLCESSSSADDVSGQLCRDASSDLKDSIDLLLLLERQHQKMAGGLRVMMLETVGQLHRSALNGDKKALRDVFLMAVDCVYHLKHLAKMLPDEVSALAKTRPDWPDFIGPHPDKAKENAETVRNLRVGEKAASQVAKGWSDRPSPGQPFRGVLGEYVNRMMDCIRAARDPAVFIQFALCPAIPRWVRDARKLPELEGASKDVTLRWFDVGWNILCSFSQDEPESLPGLGEVGEFRAGTWERMDATAGQQASQARQALRERLRGAFLARYFPGK